MLKEVEAKVEYNGDGVISICTALTGFLRDKAVEGGGLSYENVRLLGLASQAVATTLNNEVVATRKSNTEAHNSMGDQNATLYKEVLDLKERLSKYEPVEPEAITQDLEVDISEEEAARRRMDVEKLGFPEKETVKIDGYSSTEIEDAAFDGDTEPVEDSFS